LHFQLEFASLSAHRRMRAAGGRAHIRGSDLHFPRREGDIMSKRRGLAAVAAACAALLCANSSFASDQADSALSLSRPIFAAESAPRKPLMNVLDRAGMASRMDEYGVNAGGFIEASWTYNFDTPDSQTNAARVFDFEDQDLTLNQIDVFVEKTVKTSGDKFDFGGRMEWIWGGDARLIHANGVFDHYGAADGPDEQFDPVQFYLQANLPVGNGIVLTAGKFVTLLGYETINPTTNPLYSHTFLFGFAIPFTHTGVMGSYQLNEHWSVTGGLVRGWDQSFEDSNDAISFLGQVKWTGGKHDIILSAITGPEQADNNSDYRTVLDAIIVCRASDVLTLVANGDFGWESDAATDGGTALWWGVAGYATYSVNDYFALQGRLEYFDDDDGARGLDTRLFGATFGVNIKPLPGNEYGQGLVIRPEIRWDRADADVFNGGDDDDQFTFGVDAIFAF
jgi:hypothetical protein